MFNRFFLLVGLKFFRCNRDIGARTKGDDRRLMRNCGVVLGCLRFIKFLFAPVGAMWLEGTEIRRLKLSGLLDEQLLSYWCL